MDVDSDRDSEHAFLRLWFVTDVFLIAVCCLRRRYSVSLCLRVRYQGIQIQLHTRRLQEAGHETMRE